MNDIKFNSLKELYQRLLPALRSKVKELNKNNMNYIKEEDIWNCLRELKWNNCKTLTLYDMVDDILNTDNIKFANYVKDKMKNIERDISYEGDNLL